MGKLIIDSEIRREDLEKQFQCSNLKVSIGDRTTERLNGFGLTPNLEIIDSVERRSPRSPPRSSAQQTMTAINRAGTISSDALKKLEIILDIILQDPQKTIRLAIDGEEDLLALPVAAFFPEGTSVFYGQPGEGLVIVDSKESKDRARSILLELGIKSLA